MVVEVQPRLITVDARGEARGTRWRVSGRCAVAGGAGGCGVWPMRKDFFPDRETDMLSWTANFAQKLASDYAALHVSAEVAQAYVDRQAEFAEAYRVAQAPETRTSLAVARKNECRRVIEQFSRGLARQIGGNLAVTDDQRFSLGLNIRKSAVRKIAAPDTGPTVQVMQVVGATAELRLCDPGRSDGRARPGGAASATIFVAVGQDRRGPSEPWRFLTMTNQTSLKIYFGNAYPPGTRVWLMARWNNRRGESSSDGIATYACLGEGGPSLGASPLRVAA